MTELRSAAAGNGRNDADGIAVFGRRVLFREIANIFIIHVHIDKAAQPAVLGKKVLTQVGILGRETAERLADRSGIELRGITLPGLRAKRRWNHNFHGHWFLNPPALHSKSSLQEL